MATSAITGSILDLTGDPHATSPVGVRLWLQSSEDFIGIGASARTGGMQPIAVAADGSVNHDGIPETVAGAPMYRLHVESTHLRAAGRQPGVTSGWFALPAGGITLGEIAEAYFAPTLVEPGMYASIADLVAAAQAAADTAAAISGLTGEDDAVALLASTPGTDTHTALSATVGTQVGVRRSLYHLNGFESFFGSVAGWVTGQRITSTTTSGASVGAEGISVADASGFVAGMQIVTGFGTATQAVHVVEGTGTGYIYLIGTLPYALPNGAAVTPLWANSTHLGPNGYIAYAHWIANATDPDSGEHIIAGTTPKVTVLGNSWISQGGTAYADQIAARIPGATVVNAGVSGNTSTALLARFDTDVPTDSDYVVFNEPGVNDDSSGVPAATQAANLETLVAKIRAIGAVPIYTGHTPLKDSITVSTHRQGITKAAIGSGYTFPSASWAGVIGDLPNLPEPDSLGVGTSALRSVTTGTQNTALGVRAGYSLTSALNNTFVGREAGFACNIGPSNVAVGHNALRDLTSGASNLAIGQGAGASLTTTSGHTMLGRNAGVLTTSGVENTFVGYQAGFAAGGDTGNATTSGTRQTVVGTEAGQGSATQVNFIVALGYRAQASGHSAIAIGASVVATGNGSVAIGRDSGGGVATAPDHNDFVLGTSLHRYKMPGLPTVAPASGSGILWNDAGTVKVA